MTNIPPLEGDKGGGSKQNGFDAIVGNPPYGAELNETMIPYLNSVYKYQNYQMDSTILFLERAILKLKTNGVLGYIIPNTMLQNLLSSKIRKFIIENTELLNVVHYKNKVFAQATVDTEVFILKNTLPNNNQINIIVSNKDEILDSFIIAQNNWIELNGQPLNILEKPEYNSISSKLRKQECLNNLCLLTQGCKPFQVGKGKPKQTRKIVDEKPFVSNSIINDTFKPLLRGSNINRYIINWNDNYFISFGDWLAEPRYSAGYEKDKIVIRQTGDSLIATFDNNKFIVRDNLYTITMKSNELNLCYVLGIINSNLLNWYYQNIINPEKGEALAQVKRGHIALLPVVNINFQNESEKQSHDRIVSLVNEMLEAKKQLQTVKTDRDKTYYENKCTDLDNAIDSEVYKLYALTEEEIKIVEGKE